MMPWSEFEQSLDAKPERYRTVRTAWVQWLKTVVHLCDRVVGPFVTSVPQGLTLDACMASLAAYRRNY
eukprot:12901851-Prorocentrum_lima.AAC.1